MSHSTTWFRSHKRMILINVILLLVFISGILYYVSQSPSPTADSITTILNSASLKACGSGEPITTCDPVNGKYSISLASNTVSTSVTLVSPTPTPLSVPSPTPTPTISTTSTPVLATLSIISPTLVRSKTTATIKWSTSSNSKGKVVYGTSPSVLTLTSGETPLSTTHQVNLSGLLRKTIYYYKIIATTPTGISAESIGNFRTQ
jgi:hypothetical protein